jgi:cell division protein FtsW (lipid II flippase)
MGAGALCVMGLWVFTLTHHPWARIALMVACTVEAVTQLIDLSTTDEVRLLVLVSTAITVLILIAVSSDEARRWVRLGSTRLSSERQD